MTNNEITQALRCCAKGLGNDDACENCKVGEIQNRREYIEFAAANAIERLTDENATLRKGIEWKDMVIALAQRKQAKAVAERDALREKKRWISVTEKTPEYDMPQLALNADGDALIANYAYGEWFDTWGQDVEVTHWMPLPEAPEENNAT